MVEGAPLETESVLARARAGDAEAFGEICQGNETRLLRQAYAVCRDEAQAEELAEVTFVEAWRCLHRYNGRCQFFTWLCAILLNRYRNTRRQTRAVSFSTIGERARDLIQAELSQATDQSDTPDEAAQLREKTALVQQCIRALPAKHQQVIYLRFYVDDSLTGIAEALGCSVGTVKSRLYHAIEKLRGMNALSAAAEDFGNKNVNL